MKPFLLAASSLDNNSRTSSTWSLRASEPQPLSMMAQEVEQHTDNDSEIGLHNVESVESSTLVSEEILKPYEKWGILNVPSLMDGISVEDHSKFNEQIFKENIRASIRELKARKLILEYEITKKNEIISKMKETHLQERIKADESFSEWNRKLQETLDFISDDISTTFDFDDHQIPNTGEENNNSFGSSETYERDLLWMKLKKFRTVYCKIIQYIEVREREIKHMELEEKCDIEEILKSRNLLEKELDHLKSKRKDMETTIASHFQAIIQLKKENESKRKNIEALKEKIEQVEEVSKLKVRELAKKLFK
ncbi:hypothetical protein FDP41_009072 [Naegleria fowleri]|uniref:Uncharacterized protein n=1 Tax=Naegleria fowleri TaxID=5763 RepID=A0A6A5AZS6_NAEFO|nr:uncharacterized protein FDP41_009072 [Naegleria fowleri]KAF0972823.1 hypothetical protein FDP41_009072 [Naegleria fowleri]CAG4718744.1 unnamed protein product [Naegleria fowleri]